MGEVTLTEGISVQTYLPGGDALHALLHNPLHNIQTTHDARSERVSLCRVWINKVLKYRSASQTKINVGLSNSIINLLSSTLFLLESLSALLGLLLLME